ncbi:MAG: methionine--tRNA ligase [Bdellovibrio sp.]|jgi:methionyl-tRNA synthetase
MQAPRQILLTTALPYANGPLHLGHMFEGLYADFWARFQKMRGHHVLFICADDTHGTPIMVEARKRGITPEQLINEAWKDHVKDFKAFQIEHTHYSSTNSPANKELCEYFYSQMKAKGNLGTKSIDQLYCDHDKMFLPDRFVKGDCPKCSSKDQYGDSCDVCGSTYAPSDLKNSYCAVCGTPPVTKPSEQILFKLNDYREYLQAWLPQHTAIETSNKMMEWFGEALREWDISRNAPYFGFQIPGYPDKYFYVWVDAPMGYVSSTKEYCEKNNLSFDDYWKSEKKTEVYHLIGKDIVYFHTLFWPALLKAAEFRSPSAVWVHGHVMVNGEKMSKSKGTFLSARVYTEHLDPMYLRYYFASKFSSGVDDVDFNLEDFAQRTNSDLIGKITNLASRGATMLGTKLDGVMSEPDAEGLELINRSAARGDEIAAFFENREFVKAINDIRALADEANRYFDEKAPWKTVEADPKTTKQVLTTTLNLFRKLAIYLKPVLPEYTAKVEKLFGEAPYTWAASKQTLTSKAVSKYEHLATRIDPVKIKAMMEANKQELTERAAREAKSGFATKPKTQDYGTRVTTPSSVTKPAPAGREGGLAAEIEIDAFNKIDLRVAQIVDAEEIIDADKLLRLKVSLGPLGERQIIAGIKSAYSAEQLRGRLVVIVANLKPRKMKFGMSEGMALAAGQGGTELFLLSPDSGAKPGDPVK